MGHQRNLLPGLTRHGHSEAARLSAQRRMYCIWFLAVVVPFAVLFCLFPSSYRSSRASLLPASAPRKPSVSIAHRQQVSDQASIISPRGHNKSLESTSSRKSGDKSVDGKSKLKKSKREPVEEDAKTKSSVDSRSIAEETSRSGIGGSKDRDSLTSVNSKKRSNKNDRKPPDQAGSKRIDEETSDELRSINGGAKSRGTQQIKKRPRVDLVSDAESEPDLQSVVDRSRSHGLREKKGTRRTDFSQVWSRSERDEELIMPGVGSFEITKTSDALETKRKGEPASTLVEKKAEVQCDLSKGRWIPDKKGPLYTNATCPWIEDDQNCMQKKGYWRWKPDDCELDRFNGKTFLKVMQSKSLAFVGDSVARIQMQSLLCLLAQVESPKPIYVDKENQSTSWHFPSSNFTVSAIWSPYLVEETSDYIEGAPEGMTKLRLDVLDTKWARLLPTIDSVVVSGGAWFQRPAVYVVRNEAIGCHACGSIAGGAVKETGFYSAYRAAIRSTLLGVRLLPGFPGWTVLHSATDLSCRPPPNLSIPATKQQQWSRKLSEIRSEELSKARKRRLSNGSGLALLETTPGPDSVPGKLTLQNCGCSPGPSDGWNQILLQILRRRPT